MPSAKSTVSKEDEVISTNQSRRPWTNGRPLSAQRSPSNACHSVTLPPSPTHRLVTSSSSPPMKFNPVVVSNTETSFFLVSCCKLQLYFIKKESAPVVFGRARRLNPHETASTGIERRLQRWEASAYPLRDLSSAEPSAAYIPHSCIYLIP